MESNLLAAAAAAAAAAEEDTYWAALNGLDEGSYRHHVAAEEQLRIHRLDAHLEASGLALNLAPACPPWTWFASPTMMSCWFPICTRGKRTFPGVLPSSVSVPVVVFSLDMRCCWEGVASRGFGAPSPLVSGFDF